MTSVTTSKISRNHIYHIDNVFEEGLDSGTSHGGLFVIQYFMSNGLKNEANPLFFLYLFKSSEKEVSLASLYLGSLCKLGQVSGQPSKHPLGDTYSQACEYKFLNNVSIEEVSTYNSKTSR